MNRERKVKVLVDTDHQEFIISYHKGWGESMGHRASVDIESNMRVSHLDVHALEQLIVELNQFEADCETNKREAEIGSIWENFLGATYKVLMISNENSNDVECPITVIYEHIVSGSIYSRPIDSFLTAMTKRKDAE